MQKFDRSYLKMAEVWAENSYCKRRKVGALIVKNNMIISDGYNGTPSGFENVCEDENGVTKPYVLHAEANAITKVAKSGNSSEDSIPLFPQMIFMGKGKHPFKKVLFLHSLLGLNTSASRSPSERSLSLTMISGRAKYSMRLSRMATPATMMSALSGMSPVKWHLSS